MLTIYSGGEEVLLDVGGQDATEAFEDVGHSDEARETLEQLLVGQIKRQVGRIGRSAHAGRREHMLTEQPGDPTPGAKTGAVAAQAQTSGAAGLGIGLYAFLALGGAAAYYAYQYLQQQQELQPTA